MELLKTLGAILFSVVASLMIMQIAIYLHDHIFDNRK